MCATIERRHRRERAPAAGDRAQPRRRDASSAATSTMRTRSWGRSSATPGVIRRTRRPRAGRCRTTRSRRDLRAPHRHAVDARMTARRRYALGERARWSAPNSSCSRSGAFTAGYVKSQLAIVRRLEGDHDAVARLAHEMIDARRPPRLRAVDAGRADPEPHLGRCTSARMRRSNRSRRRSRSGVRMLSIERLDAVLADRAGGRAGSRPDIPSERGRRSTRRWRVASLTGSEFYSPRDAARARRAALRAGRSRGRRGHLRGGRRRRACSTRTCSSCGRPRPCGWSASARCPRSDAPGRDPRRRDGRPDRRVGAQRARAARSLRDHGLPARLAARRQGREQPRRRTGASRSTGCTSGWAYYDNAFRLMREVYDELERERTDPGCPIAELARRVHPRRPGRSRGALRRGLVALGGDVRRQRPRAGDRPGRGGARAAARDADVPRARAARCWPTSRARSGRRPRRRRRPSC